MRVIQFNNSRIRLFTSTAIVALTIVLFGIIWQFTNIAHALPPEQPGDYNGRTYIVSTLNGYPSPKGSNSKANPTEVLPGETISMGFQSVVANNADPNKDTTVVSWANIDANPGTLGITYASQYNGEQISTDCLAGQDYKGGGAGDDKNYSCGLKGQSVHNLFKLEGNQPSNGSPVVHNLNFNIRIKNDAPDGASACVRHHVGWFNLLTGARTVQELIDMQQAEFADKGSSSDRLDTYGISVSQLYCYKVNRPPPPPTEQPTTVGITCRNFRYDKVKHANFRFRAYYENKNHGVPDTAEGPVQNTMGGWANLPYPVGDSSIPGNLFNHYESNTSDNVQSSQTYNFPGPGNATDRKVYAEWWQHGEFNSSHRGNEWKYFRRIAVVTNCSYWDLYPFSGVSSDYVEIGSSMTFGHVVDNRSTFAAHPFERAARYPRYNYDINNVGAGTGGFRDGSIRLSPVMQPGNNNVSNDNPGQTLSVPGDVSMLGATFCQNIVVDASSKDTVDNYGGPRSSSDACTHVVGGKSKIAVSGGDSAMEPGEAVNFDTKILTRNFTKYGDYQGYDLACNWRLTEKRADGSESTLGSGGCSNSAVRSNDTINAHSLTHVGMTIGSKYCYTATISHTNGNLLEEPTVGTSCFDVVAKPYVKVYGGDIVSGRGFSGGAASCSSPSSVIGWNRDGDAYTGASAEFAIFAQNKIQSFASGQTGSANPAYANPPKDLSFANASNSPFGSPRTYGGNFDGMACMPDYYGAKPPDAETIVWNNITNANETAVVGTPQAFRHNGNLTLGNGQVKQGNATKLYVRGDLYVDGNITAEAGADTLGKVPGLTVVVQGDIYIAANVTELFGVYVAQPASSGGGNIYTCAEASGRPLTLSAANYERCKNRLTITGAFAADKVHFLRTNGSLVYDGGGGVGGSGFNNAGEVFLYNPLTWVRQTTGGSNPRESAPAAITTLPPVL